MSEIEINELADAIADRMSIYQKEMLTIEEAARYTGYSKSSLYKLTASKSIPHYKPTGGTCYINRVELEEWMQSNRVSTEAELNVRAAAHCNKNGGGRL